MTKKPEMIVTDDGPEMEDIVDFINDNKLKMHVLLAHENPYRSKQQQGGSVHWSCKLINSDKQHIIVFFSKGALIRRWCQSPQTGLGDTIPVHVPHDKINKPYDGPMPPWDDETSDQDKRTFELCSQIEPPYLIEVLDVLARDVLLIEQSGAFENWCSLLKISQDSRSAKSAFDVVLQQRMELQALLGEEAFHRLLYEIDRINPIRIVDEDDS